MQARLDRLRAALTAHPSITLGPPADPAAVAALEARAGAPLPEAFRRFVLEVGDGFAFDGEPQVYSLAQAAQASTGNDPARPFGYGDADAATIRAEVARAAADGDVMGDAAVMALQRGGFPDGCLVVATSGCDENSTLVVTGEQRGWMWRTGVLDAPETRALYDGGGDLAPLDFLDWVEVWTTCMLGVTL